MGGVNFVTTIINMRAPGMRLMRMPLFTWMAFVTSFLIITALPVLAVALFMLTFDRTWGTNFFDPGAGGDPVMWQHLFWIFGHPEVYILILPAFGIISEILPTFSRKPLFGYSIMVYSGVLIGLIGWGVWAHHMFATGMGAIADAFFTVGTMIIAIPTGVKIFNWLATMWGGQLRFTTAMMFAIGSVATFTFGGVSGIMHATSPHDLQQHDTYFVVAHFHYVLFGGLILSIFGGFYYWWPKLTGKFLSEKIGKWQFWALFIGFNVTFFPQHFIGLLGMPRRVFTYSEELNLGGLNMLSTLGGYLTGIGALLFFWNVWASRRSTERATPNPWGAATLEWAHRIAAAGAQLQQHAGAAQPRAALARRTRDRGGDAGRAARELPHAERVVVADVHGGRRRPDDGAVHGADVVGAAAWARMDGRGCGELRVRADADDGRRLQASGISRRTEIYSDGVKTDG